MAVLNFTVTSRVFNNEHTPRPKMGVERAHSLQLSSTLYPLTLSVNTTFGNHCHFDVIRCI